MEIREMDVSMEQSAERFARIEDYISKMQPEDFTSLRLLGGLFDDVRFLLGLARDNAQDANALDTAVGALRAENAQMRKALHEIATAPVFPGPWRDFAEYLQAMADRAIPPDEWVCADCKTSFASEAEFRAHLDDSPRCYNDGEASIP